MFEAEVKMRIKDPEAARAGLLGAGAVAEPAVLQEDVYFRHAQRDLEGADEALRLRRAGGAMELTFKGPRQGGEAKVRREVTVRVQDDPTPLLAQLGYRPAVSLRKTRQLLRLGAAHITLDHLEGLGWFVEVERTGTRPARLEREVRRVLEQAGLVGEPVAESYLELALREGAAAARRAP